MIINVDALMKKFAHMNYEQKKEALTDVLDGGKVTGPILSRIWQMITIAHKPPVGVLDFARVQLMNVIRFGKQKLDKHVVQTIQNRLQAIQRQEQEEKKMDNIEELLHKM